MATVDLTVRGAGIFGLATAWTALQRGAKVRVIDPNGPAAGASGGIVGALQPHTPDVWNEKKQFQFEALTMAPKFWQDVEAASGLPTGYAKAGRLQPLAGEREVVMARARANGAGEFWGSAANWEVIEASSANDWHPPSHTGLYIHDTLSAILHPRKACESLAAAISANGGDIVQDAKHEGRVLWANGWKGLEALSAALDKPVGNGVKGQAALLKYNAAGNPQIFASGLHIVPHLDGTVAIGSTSEREFSDPNSTDHLLDDIIQRAKDLMPILADAPVITRWAGVRPRAKSRAPLLGAWPDRADHFAANGGFKIGFGVAPMIAQTMCDLILNGHDTIPEGFRITA